MKTYAIATIPGDGIGKEVVPAGQQVLEALARASPDFRFEFENFGWGGDHYRAHGVMMPADGLDALRHKDAILFGSAGDPDIPDHITLWGLRLNTVVAHTHDGHNFKRWQLVHQRARHPGLAAASNATDFGRDFGKFRRITFMEAVVHHKSGIQRRHQRRRQLGDGKDMWTGQGRSRGHGFH